MKKTKNYSEQIERLIEISDSIDPKKITILTGSNGSGKSLIRKMLNFDKLKVASTSMERRAGLNMHGAMGAFMSDADWNPTSVETIKLIEGVLSQDDRYLVIDEPEIGMGEETVLGLAYFLNKKLKETKKGIMLITHSRVLVENLDHDQFFNIDGLDREQWLTRELVPVDVESLRETTHELFLAIQERINDYKSKKD